MQAPTAPARAAVPAGGIILGGVVVAAGAFLPWFEISSPGQDTESLAGTDLSAVLGVLLVGALAAVAGIVVLIRSRRGGRAGGAWAVAAIVLAVVAAILSIYSVAAPEDALTSIVAQDLADQLGVTQAQGEAALKTAFATGQLSATVQTGSIVSSVGSVIALIGSIAARRRIRATPGGPAAPVAPGTPMAPPPPPPPPAQGI